MVSLKTFFPFFFKILNRVPRLVEGTWKRIYEESTVKPSIRPPINRDLVDPEILPFFHRFQQQRRHNCRSRIRNLLNAPVVNWIYDHQDKIVSLNHNTRKPAWARAKHIDNSITVFGWYSWKLFDIRFFALLVYAFALLPRQISIS